MSFFWCEEGTFPFHPCRCYWDIPGNKLDKEKSSLYPISLPSAREREADRDRDSDERGLRETGTDSQRKAAGSDTLPCNIAPEWWTGKVSTISLSYRLALSLPTALSVDTCMHITYIIHIIYMYITHIHIYICVCVCELFNIIRV